MKAIVEQGNPRRPIRRYKNSRKRRRGECIRNIIVPVDFSDCSLAALKYGIRFAKQRGGRITVVHVVDLGPVLMTSGWDYQAPYYFKAADRRDRGCMQTFLKRIDPQGVSVKALAVAGYCPAAIRDIAIKRGADLIIMSTHGRTGLRRAVMGSVAEETVRHAPCPVLVVPSFANAHKSPSGQSRHGSPARRSNSSAAQEFQNT